MSKELAELIETLTKLQEFRVSLVMRRFGLEAAEAIDDEDDHMVDQLLGVAPEQLLSVVQEEIAKMKTSIERIQNGGQP